MIGRNLSHYKFLEPSVTVTVYKAQKGTVLRNTRPPFMGNSRISRDVISRSALLLHPLIRHGCGNWLSKMWFVGEARSGILMW